MLDKFPDRSAMSGCGPRAKPGDPVLVLERALRPGSGGARKFRGGLGVDFKIRNLVEGRWNLNRPRRINCPPWGLWGGKSGRTAAYLSAQAAE